MGQLCRFVPFFGIAPLTNPSNATITDGQALGTITDNDYPPTSVELANLSVQGSGYAGALLALLIMSGFLLAIRKQRE